MDNQAIWSSKEFVAAIVGALIGGALSVFASFISVRLQYLNQDRERRKLVRDFVLEHANYFKELTDRLLKHYDIKNEIWAELVVEIKTAYDVFVRNIEHTVLLRNQNDRQICRKFFSEIHFISQRCWFWQNRYYEFKKALDSGVSDEKELAAVRESLRSAEISMRECAAELKIACGSFFELEQKLKSY